MPKRTPRRTKQQRRRPSSPRSRGELLPASFLHHLSKHVAGFARLSPQVRHDLAYLAWIDGSWRQRHSTLDGYMTIHYRDLYRRFGRTGFNAANTAVPMFEVTRQWWSGHGLTRGYKLTAEVAAIKSAYLRARNVRMTHMMQSDGKRMRTIPDAVAAKDVEGRTETVWRNAKVVSKVPVDLDRLRLLQDRLVRLQDDIEAGRGTADMFIGMRDLDTVRWYCDALGQVLRLAKTTVADSGHIPTRYIVGKTGRLYARGISLQTVPRMVRKVALHGMWDYDIENCHYAIFKQLAARFGYDAQAIAAYLASKKATRQGIADRVGITYDEVKTCLLAIMYGARQSSRDVDAIPEAIGKDAALRLYADPVFAELLRDIRTGRQTILAAHPKGRTTLTNAVGLKIRLADPAEERLAHLIQGIEAQALRAAQATYPDDIVLLMHDGWVSLTRLDVPRMVAVMRAATGYEFDLSEDPIVLPPDLDLSNLT